MKADELRLRPGTTDDAPALADLFLAARRASEPAIPASVHTPTEIHRWFADLLRLDPSTGSGHRELDHRGEPEREPSRRETWVAERSSAVVGFLTLEREWLDSIYVRPDLTGQGIGIALLDLAKSLRPGGFGLWVFETNAGARRFYARHGLLALERTDGLDNEEKAPDIAMVWPGEDPLAHLRRKIDAVDIELGKVLARRAALTSAIQRFKPVSGHEGRDLAREAEIADRLAAHASNLGPDRIQRIMHVVITESLDAAAERTAAREPVSTDQADMTD